MKIRKGFVSNSSSSSFVIVSKKGKLTQDKLKKCFDVSEKSPLYHFAKEAAKSMMFADEYSLEDYKEEYLWSDCTDAEFKEDYPEMCELYENAKKNGWNIYMGSADSCDEAALCEMEINYEDDDIKIEKEGGY